jgi:hypothetical protein
MTKVNKGNAVALDKYIDASRARIYYGNMALVYPEKGAYPDRGAWEQFTSRWPIGTSSTSACSCACSSTYVAVFSIMRDDDTVLLGSRRSRGDVQEPDRRGRQAGDIHGLPAG